MAYRCSGRTNDQLVENLKASGLIDSELVASVFRKVDRKNYVLDEWDAYIDAPQGIMCNATISAPHMHAEATKHLRHFLKPGARVLDVGSGSGYTCAIFHHLVSPDGAQGLVVGIDHMPELVTWSIENLRKDGLQGALDAGRIEMIADDGRRGWAARAPYDVIHVGAAAPTMPAPLIEQLARPGRMFIPVGIGGQRIFLVDKDVDGNVTERPLLHVMYVPLTDRESQENRRF